MFMVDRARPTSYSSRRVLDLGSSITLIEEGECDAPPGCLCIAISIRPAISRYTYEHLHVDGGVKGTRVGKRVRLHRRQC